MIRRQFTIRTLLVAMTVGVLLLAWVASNLQKSSVEKQAMSEIQEKYSGFNVIERSSPLMCGMGVSGIADRTPTNPVSRFLGNWWPNSFDRVTRLHISGLRYDNDILAIVDRLPGLQTFEIYETSLTAFAIEGFKKSNPHVKVDVVESTFEMSDENDERQQIERLLHW